MNNYTIKTDSKWNDFIYGAEVPKKVLAEYDHLDNADAQDGFIKYRNNWYHVSDFLKTDSFPGWDGLFSLGFFSGILIQISPDNEKYRIATLTG